MRLKRKTQRATGNRIINILREHEDVLKKYKVKRIGLFGSYAKGTQRRKSDIDFLVEFEQPNFDDFMSLASYLEKLFGKKIDILTPEGVKGIRVRGIAEKITKNLLYV
ncbi:MAG: nucleotidyltransferase family protein [Candidatus Omnitrophica bacterium]|nr:nucleotidyltransferase family protein [Candidatus Omnitrophota bacterium]